MQVKISRGIINTCKYNTYTGKDNMGTGKYTQTGNSERNLLHIYASGDLRTSTCNNYINLLGTITSE